MFSKHEIGRIGGLVNTDVGRFCVDRHKKAINVGFVDSRVERVPLEELWAQKWHKNFIPNSDVSIP